MYPKFIEVTRVDRNETWKSSIHVAQIVFFEDHTVWCTSSDDDENCGMVWVEETYDDLKQLIKDCGCLIHKADPRLDTTTPLTLEELANMIGEPVWNSNLSRWELVKHVTDITVTTCHTGQYCSQYDDDDLIKTPLYRMKVNNG